MFTFIKETFNLVKWLFCSKPTDSDELVETVTKYYPIGSKYMMWCGRLVYKESTKDLIDSQRETEMFKRDINHETIHLKQAQKKKWWLCFYINYGWQWLIGNPFWKPFESAYYTNPYEMEAYGNDEDYDYPKNYDGSFLHCYKLKKRKKTYKEHEDNWDEYCQSIIKTKE